MKALRGTAFAMATVLVMLSSSILTAAILDNDGEPLASPPGPPKLLLKCGEFDPLAEAPPVPDGLVIQESQGVYILQFDGPIYPGQTERLQQFAEILGYIPDYAFAIRADPKYIDEARAIGHVRYIGLFHPGYKMDPALKLDGSMRVLSIACFKSEDIPRAESDITALGGRMVVQDPLRVRVEAPASLAIRIAFLPEVQWVQEYNAPGFDNNNAAKIVKARSSGDGAYNWGTSSLWSYNTATGKFEGYAGANFSAAVADTGIDGTHPAFSGKKVAYYGYGGADWYDYYGSIAHGTHTAGTVLGNGAWRTTDPGTAGYYAGMAPKAGLVGQLVAGYCTIFNLCNDAVKSGASVSSNSWGGGSYGAYDDSAQEYDSLVRDADPNKAGNQSLTVCFSAGNDGPGGTIDPPSTGKNVICVGATDNYAGGTTIAYFSSQGPCVDGRIKPDIVAPGYALTSCRGNSAGSYQSMQGTSMSCPVVAGGSILVYEYYNATRKSIPSPAMVKDLLINGADAMAGYTYPGPAQGWGRLNLARSLLNTTSRKIWTEDQRFLLTTGAARSYIFNVTALQELKISLVWTDVNGTLLANPALVNDLDLTVTAPNGTVYLGNQFTGGYSTPNGTADKKNNVEVFRMAQPPVGSWLVNVRARNVPIGKQDYSLVIGGAFDNVTSALVDVSADRLSIQPADPAEGDATLISGSVLNIGDLPERAVRYQFKLTDQSNITRIVGEGAVALLPRNEERVSANWTAVRGCYTLSLEVDPYIMIAEDHEDNNIISQALKVRGYGLSLTAPNTTLYVDPGLKSDLELVVHNRANTNDTLTLAVDSPPPAGWAVRLANDSLAVPERVNQSFRAAVTAPADALAGAAAQLRIRATSQGNRTYTDVINVTVMVNQTFGLGLTSPSAELWVLPGVLSALPLKVDNLGNGRDAIFLTLTGVPQGWQAYLSSSYFVLPALWSENISLIVVPPPNAQALFSAAMKIEASYDGGKTKSLAITTRVVRVAQLELELADGPDDVDPGATASFVLRVRNLGNGADPFEMAAELPDGWSGEFSNVVPVKAGDFALVDLKLSVPKEALAGEQQITLIAGSGTNKTVTAELGLALFVNQYYGVNLSAEETRAAVDVGNFTTFDLVVNNTGNGEDIISIASEDSLAKGWRITFYPGQADLPAGGTTTVQIKVRPASDAVEGSFFFSARATSSGDSTKASSVRFRVDVSIVPTQEQQPPVNQPPPRYNGSPPPEAPNAVTSWVKGHWYLPVALIALMIVAIAAVAVSRSRRRARLRAQEQATEPAGASSDYPAEESALISRETTTPTAWETPPAPQARVPWEEEAPAPEPEYRPPPEEWQPGPPQYQQTYTEPEAPPMEEPPEPELETIEMGMPVTAPAPVERRVIIRPSTSRTSRPAAARAPAAAPKKKVDSEIEDILARIAEISKK